MIPNLPQIASASFQAQQKTGCPGLLLIAQCGIETGWLRASPGNNCFGIKQYPGCYGRQLLHTTEDFTQAELQWFVNLGEGRTANLVHPIQTDSRGAFKYAVQDWFATFAVLGDCFAKRSQMWDKGPYAPAAARFKQDGNLTAYVNSIGPIYAKAGNYAAEVLTIINEAEVQAAWQVVSTAGKDATFRP